MNWVHEGVWGDSQMPDVSLITTNFFGNREGLDINLSPAINYFGDIIRSGKVILDVITNTWLGRGDVFPYPLAYARTSIDSGNSFQDLYPGGFIPNIYGKNKVRLNLYIRSDFVDLVPFEGVIILKARVLVSNRYYSQWPEEGKPFTAWKVTKGIDVHNMNTEEEGNKVVQPTRA